MKGDRIKHLRPDKYGRGSAATNGAGFVDLAPGEAVDVTKDAWPERTPRGAKPEGLNAAPLLDLASFVESIVAYYVGDCNRTRPEFVNRTEPFSVARAAELVAALVFNAESQNPLDAAPVHDWLARARNLGYMLTNLEGHCGPRALGHRHERQCDQAI